MAVFRGLGSAEHVGLTDAPEAAKHRLAATLTQVRGPTTGAACPLEVPRDRLTMAYRDGRNRLGAFRLFARTRPEKRRSTHRSYWAR